MYTVYCLFNIYQYAIIFYLFILESFAEMIAYTKRHIFQTLQHFHVDISSAAKLDEKWLRLANVDDSTIGYFELYKLTLRAMT